jgi:hypothetical protein
MLEAHLPRTSMRREDEARSERIRQNVLRNEERIARIAALIEQMRAHGQCTVQAERLLRNHRQFLRLSLEFLELEAAQRALKPMPFTKNGL